MDDKIEFLKYGTAVLAGAFTIGSVCFYFLKRWFERRELIEKELQQEQDLIRKDLNEALIAVRKEADVSFKGLEDRVNLFEREIGILTQQTVQNATSTASLVAQISTLTLEVNNLSKTVIKQTTLLDERLPKRT